MWSTLKELIKIHGKDKAGPWSFLKIVCLCLTLVAVVYLISGGVWIIIHGTPQPASQASQIFDQQTVNRGPKGDSLIPEMVDKRIREAFGNVPSSSANPLSKLLAEYRPLVIIVPSPPAAQVAARSRKSTEPPYYWVDVTPRALMSYNVRMLQKRWCVRPDFPEVCFMSQTDRNEVIVRRPDLLD